MAHQPGKKYRKMLEGYDPTKLYDMSEAAAIVKRNASDRKFNETVELHIRLGVDPKKSDQNVRGTVSLPHGTGRTVRVIAFAKGDKAKEAEAAGADVVGDADLIERVKGGFADFDVAVATPAAMAEVKKLGKVLGPRGLMPNPKTGTVTDDTAKAVKEVKAGRVEFKLDKNANVAVPVGKFSFDETALEENGRAVIDAVVKARPASAKGFFVEAITLSATMSPGVTVDPAPFLKN